MESADVLEKRDAGFARRLEQRDETVLGEIDSAYSASLRRLLRRSRGPSLNDDDIDEILCAALFEVWTKYDAKRKTSLRMFYFRVAKSRLIDHLRAYRRERGELERSAPALAADNRECEPSPAAACVASETSEIYTRILKLVDIAVAEHLTPRQRIAFLRRKGALGGSHWAKRLEEETGKPAKSWRKASDEAFRIIRGFLEDNNVVFSDEGIRYEMESARSTA